jgi:hypothetical protein
MDNLKRLTAAAIVVTGAIYLLGLLKQEEPIEPSILQWTNRLIEHIEPENILEASKRFLYLIDNGLVPAHAFEIIVRS